MTEMLPEKIEDMEAKLKEAANKVAENPTKDNYDAFHKLAFDLEKANIDIFWKKAVKSAVIDNMESISKKLYESGFFNEDIRNQYVQKCKELKADLNKDIPIEIRSSEKTAELQNGNNKLLPEHVAEINKDKKLLPEHVGETKTEEQKKENDFPLPDWIEEKIKDYNKNNGDKSNPLYGQLASANKENNEFVATLKDNSQIRYTSEDNVTVSKDAGLLAFEVLVTEGDNKGRKINFGENLSRDQAVKLMTACLIHGNPIGQGAPTLTLEEIDQIRASLRQSRPDDLRKFNENLNKYNEQKGAKGHSNETPDQSNSDKGKEGKNENPSQDNPDKGKEGKNETPSQDNAKKLAGLRNKIESNNGNTSTKLLAVLSGRVSPHATSPQKNDKSNVNSNNTSNILPTGRNIGGRE